MKMNTHYLVLEREYKSTKAEPVFVDTPLNFQKVTENILCDYSLSQSDKARKLQEATNSYLNFSRKYKQEEKEEKNDLRDMIERILEGRGVTKPRRTNTPIRKPLPPTPSPTPSASSTEEQQTFIWKKDSPPPRTPSPEPNDTTTPFVTAEKKTPKQLQAMQRNRRLGTPATPDLKNLVSAKLTPSHIVEGPRERKEVNKLGMGGGWIGAIPR